MRKLTLLLTLGLFLSATAANACDGDKAMKNGKGKKATAAACADQKCMKNGKCTMTAAAMKKSGCCAHEATASAATKSGCDAKAAASGAHKCCKAKSETGTKS
jgi:hypothetical protein